MAECQVPLTILTLLNFPRSITVNIVGNFSEEFLSTQDGISLTLDFYLLHLSIQKFSNSIHRAYLVRFPSAIAATIGSTTGNGCLCVN
jgi:hypothetical protein